MEIIDIFVEFINAFLHMYIAHVFFSSFFEVNRKKGVVYGCIAVCSILFTVALLFLKGNVLIYVPMLITTFALTFSYDCKLGTRVLFPLIYLVISGVAEMIVAVAIAALFSVDMLVGKEGVLYISGMLISKLVIFLLFLFIRVSKRKTVSILFGYGKKYISLFLFPAATLSVAALQHKLFVNFPDQSAFVKYWALLSYVALILANIIVFDFIETLHMNMVNEERVKASNEIIANQKAQFQAAIDHNEKILKIRHDHKNFCAGLRGALTAGRIDEAVEILDREYDLNKNENEGISNTALAIVDIKKQIAEKKGIDFIWDCKNVEKILIQPTDLAVVLGNALDNAIEACEMLGENEKKYIETNISIKNDTVYAMIKNPVVSDIDANNLVSSKLGNASNHGFGIISMRQIVKRYSGEVLFSCEDKVFTTVIVMKDKKR